MFKTNLPKNIEENLYQEPITNLNILGFFEKHTPLQIKEYGNSTMISGQSDELWWYLHCNSQEDFDKFTDELSTGNHFFSIIPDWILTRLKSQFQIHWVLTCNKFYLPNEVELPNIDIKIERLIPEDSYSIFEHSNYKAFTSREYIEEQIVCRSGAAFRNAKKLAGWALFHDDGAMGMLHVVDDYRRKGVARTLMVELCKIQRSQNRIPYTSVEPTNIASSNLVKSLGFVNTGTVHWVKFSK